MALPIRDLRGVHLPCAQPSVGLAVVATSQPSYHANAGARLFCTRTVPPYALCLRPDEEIDSAIRATGRWPDCKNLPELIRQPGASGVSNESSLFVDVGANIGACSMLMAAHGYAVISFEPVVPTFAALSAAFAANTFAAGADVRLINAAASDSVGRSVILSRVSNSGDSITTGAARDVPSAYWSLTTGHGKAGSNYTRQAIRLTTLDRALPLGRPISLLKIDRCA